MYQNRIFIYNANHMYGIHFGANIKFRGITSRYERRRFCISSRLFKMRYQIKVQSHIFAQGIELHAINFQNLIHNIDLKKRIQIFLSLSLLHFQKNLDY